MTQITLSAPPRETTHAVRLEAVPRLTDPWPGATLAMAPAPNNPPTGPAGIEPGRVSFGWDDQALYLRTHWTDRAIVTAATADGQSLFQMGDVVEWFLGPANRDWYIELHVSPREHRTWYAYKLPEGVKASEKIPFSAQTRVSDGAWEALMTVTWSTLQRFDASVDPSTPLLTLIGRYNYADSQGMAPPELSCWPEQPQRNFHLRPHHALLTIAPCS